ncbi:hypothetical protein KW496_19715 [Vibrio fluvialis]|nr:hypothetical protein [Vibrio fluvialis]
MSIYDEFIRNGIIGTAKLISIGLMIACITIFGVKHHLFGNILISGCIGAVLGSALGIGVFYIAKLIDIRFYGEHTIKQSFNDYVKDLEPTEISELAESALENYKVRAAIEDHLEFESAEQKHKFSKIKNT